MSDQENIDLSSLSETDKYYLKGGFRYDPKWGKEFIENATSLANGKGRLLDLACGDGFWSFILAEWYEVTGEDLSRGGIHMARKRREEEGKSLRFELKDSLEETEMFDIVFARGPSFWSNKEPNDPQFALGLERVVARTRKKLVYITYTVPPYGQFNETKSSYYHDPGVIQEKFSKFGDTAMTMDGNYLVCELDKTVKKV